MSHRPYRVEDVITRITRMALVSDKSDAMAIAGPSVGKDGRENADYYRTLLQLFATPRTYVDGQTGQKVQRGRITAEGAFWYMSRIQGACDERDTRNGVSSVMSESTQAVETDNRYHWDSRSRDAQGRFV